MNEVLEEFSLLELGLGGAKVGVMNFVVGVVHHDQFRFPLVFEFATHVGLKVFVFGLHELLEI